MIINGLIQILHDDVHWLEVADRVTHKLGVIMHRCRHGKDAQYLVDCCTPVTDVVGRPDLPLEVGSIKYRLYTALGSAISCPS